MTFGSILVPIDCSEESSWRKALPSATELVRACDAQMHVMTVVREIDAFWKAQYSLFAYERLLSEAEARLASIVAQSVPRELEPRMHVASGSIYAEIMRVASDIDADLIVMASHRPEMKDYLIGTNAAKVVRHARCSVLVVRDA